jgi:hypothetical protein
MVVRKVAASLALLIFSAAAIALAQGKEAELVVQLASGRQFKGVIDSASTAQQLVLRSNSGGITLRRPIRWDRVQQATIDGKRVEVATLQGAAAKNASRPSEVMARESGAGGQNSGVSGHEKTSGGKGSLLRRIELRGEAAPATKDAEEQPTVESPPARVAMVTFDPYIANWDGDVETDGVVIDVMPLDINRYIVPVNGTLEVELFVAQRRIQLDLAPMSGGDTLELVERWTRAIAPEDFGPSGVRLRLPFGAITPELRPSWTASWYGLVHVRLAIPGQGVFEDSRDGVRIRPWAPNRDRLEMKTGQRFLPTENLGRRE